MTCSSSRRPSLDSRGDVHASPDPMSAVTDALMAVSGVRRLCVSASSSAAFSCSLRRAASASLARSNAAPQLLIELLDFAAALLRLELAPLGPRRQLADDDRGDGEREERDPVVRILDGEADRRQEVVRERERRRRPSAASAGPVPHDARDQQDGEQQHRRGGAGGDRRDAPAAPTSTARRSRPRTRSATKLPSGLRVSTCCHYRARRAVDSHTVS